MYGQHVERTVALAQYNVLYTVPYIVKKGASDISVGLSDNFKRPSPVRHGLIARAARAPAGRHVGSTCSWYNVPLEGNKN